MLDHFNHFEMTPIRATNEASSVMVKEAGNECQHMQFTSALSLMKKCA